MLSRFVSSRLVVAGLRRLSSNAAAAGSTSTLESTILQPNTTIPLPITSKLTIADTNEQAKIPVFRMLDPSGKLLVDSVDPAIDEAQATKMYQMMVRIHYLDDIMYNAQRQGRISFYMQASGEEAIHVGKFTRQPTYT